MYSRKSIRAYQPMTRYLPVGAEEPEAKVTPPPDYTGMAFYDRPETVDYPETLIPPPEEEESIPTEESLSADAEAPLPDSEEEETIPASEMPSAPMEAERAENALPLAQSDEASSSSAEPLLSPTWLRALTLEDMLLFWLILLLLSGEPEDQIYLLLGLLLFTGR